MNLTIMLLVSRRFVSRAEIQQRIEGYRDLSQSAFERAFERDKDELRALGVPIETGSNDPLLDLEEGYRIRRQDFELPAVEFSTDEAAVLALAANVWQEVSAADQVNAALTKLGASQQHNEDRLHALVPSIGPREPAFDVIKQALQENREVSFDYREIDRRRTVQPWQLAMRGRAWYLYGFDVDRGEPRLFKLSRFASKPVLGKRHAGQIPVATQIADRFAELDEDLTLLLAIRDGAGAPFRRSGQALDRNESACDQPLAADQAADSDLALELAIPQGYSLWRVRQRRLGLVESIASFGSDVIVLAPADVRAEVIEHLRRVVAQHGGAAAESGSDR